VPVHLIFARRAIAPLIHAFGCRGGLPLRIHVEQVDEEIIGQRLGPVGEDAVFGMPEVSIQGAQATDEYTVISGQSASATAPDPPAARSAGIWCPFRR